MLRLLARRRARNSRPQMILPAPGPSPAARPPGAAIVIFVVVLIVMGCLLDRGYTVQTALEAVAGAGVLSAVIVARLADGSA
jgi:hypothetical protein